MNSQSRVFIVLGSDRNGISVDSSFDFLGTTPQIGDVLLCDV